MLFGVPADADDDVLYFRPLLFLSALFILWRTVSRDWLEPSESELLDELLSELEVSSHPAAGPGVDSASTMCCGVDSYINA